MANDRYRDDDRRDFQSDDLRYRSGGERGFNQRGPSQQQGERFSRDIGSGERYGGAGPDVGSGQSGNFGGDYARDTDYSTRRAGESQYGSRQSGDYDVSRGNRAGGARGGGVSDYANFDRDSAFGSRDYAGGYGDRSFSGARAYGGGDRGRSEGGRDFWDKATDEVSSWFGDEDAERRRDRDKHRGRGPKNYQRSDERIRDDVNDRLTDDPSLDASDIEVEVKDREVTLSGKIASRWDKRRAEDIAEDISGVAHVQNNLRVRTGAEQDTTSGVSATTAGMGSRSPATGR